MMINLLTFLAWVGYSVLCFSASMLAVILAPFVVPFADKYSGTLPKGFRWMETFDQPLPGDMNEPQVKWVYEKLGWYVSSVHWLWRNKAYGVSKLWRAQINELSKAKFHIKGNRDKGFYLITVEDDLNWWFEFRFSLPLKWFKLVLRAGWKLTPYLDRNGVDYKNWDKTNAGIQVLSILSRSIDG